MKYQEGARRGSRRRSRGGMTMIEVMISMAIMSVLMLSSTFVFTGNLQSVDQSKSLTRAASFLDTVMEGVSTQPFPNLLSLSGDRVFEVTDATDSTMAVDITAFVAGVNLIQIRAIIVDLSTGRELGRTTLLRTNR